MLHKHITTCHRAEKSCLLFNVWALDVRLRVMGNLPFTAFICQNAGFTVSLVWEQWKCSGVDMFLAFGLAMIEPSSSNVSHCLGKHSHGMSITNTAATCRLFVHVCLHPVHQFCQGWFVCVRSVQEPLLPLAGHLALARGHADLFDTSSRQTMIREKRTRLDAADAFCVKKMRINQGKARSTS